jgi:Lipocalin-like domain
MTDLRLTTASLSLAFVFAIGTAFAAAPSDDEMSHEILGSWVVPVTSSDYSPNLGYVVETFRADGTYTATEYSSVNCKTILKQQVALWSVSKGVLISTFGNGGGSKDEIKSIVGSTMTLHSLDDGTTYTRAKIEACGQPVS